MLFSETLLLHHSHRQCTQARTLLAARNHIFSIEVLGSVELPRWRAFKRNLDHFPSPQRILLPQIASEKFRWPSGPFTIFWNVDTVVMRSRCMTLKWKAPKLNSRAVFFLCFSLILTCQFQEKKYRALKYFPPHSSSNTSWILGSLS